MGAGPAGLYGADALLKRGAQVDVFEAQFAPFGLVRYGVAPDHQKIKKTQVVFEKILHRPHLRLFANVRIGTDVTVPQLLDHYDQILVTMGSSGARALQVPGESLPGSLSATEFVNWYNSHPDFVDLAPVLDHPVAVVVGMGNVAIDVARILLRDPEDLDKTDISPVAVRALEKSRVNQVVLLARRGPNQAAFDQKEVRELAALPGIEVGVAGYIPKRRTPMSEFIASFPRANQLGGKKRVILWFCASPVEILGQTRVEAIRIEKNHLVQSAARMRAVGTGEYTKLECGLVLRAIGYHGTPLPDVSFSQETGTIPNDEGRVLDAPHGQVVRGLYVAGWIKRGPTGLIGTNKSCAVETVARMEEDLDQVGPERDPDAIVRLLRQRGVRFITEQEWTVLDAHETREGAARGRVRDKLSSLEQALKVLELRGQMGVA